MFLCFIFYRRIAILNTDFESGEYECGPGDDGCRFKIDDASRTISMVYFYNLEDDDTVYYRYRTDGLWRTDNFQLATNEEKHKPFRNSQEIYLIVQTKTVRNIQLRAGRTSNLKCRDGTYMSTLTHFSLSDFIFENGIDIPSEFCVIFLHKSSSVSITDTMTKMDDDYNSNEIYYKRGSNMFQRIDINEKVDLTSGENPLYLSFDLIFPDDTNLVFDFTNVEGPQNSDIDFSSVDIDNPKPRRTKMPTISMSPTPTFARTPYLTPDDTPYITAFETPFSTVFSTFEITPIRTNKETPFKTAASTPSWTFARTPFLTMHRTPEKSEKIIYPRTAFETPYITPLTTPSSTNPDRTFEPTKSSISYLIPPRTLVNTPEATWDGEWDDPTNVIIRGDDIPEIHENHPPIQTEYLKTEVPKKTTFINVSTGTILIVAVVIFTIINIVRTYRRLRRGGSDYVQDDVSDLSFSSSVFTSYDSDENGFY